MVLIIPFLIWYAQQQEKGISLNSFKSNLCDQIILDSGLTDYMFCNKYFLKILEPTTHNQYIIVANGMKAKVNGVGELKKIQIKLKTFYI
jgi:hypothetical protein